MEMTLQIYNPSNFYELSHEQDRMETEDIVWRSTKGTPALFVIRLKRRNGVIYRCSIAETHR